MYFLRGQGIYESKFDELKPYRVGRYDQGLGTRVG